MSTYASLTQDIQDFSENDDTEFVAEIPNFIALAEQRIFRDFKGLTFNTTSTSVTLTTNTATAAVPADLITPRWVRIYASTFLQQKDETFVRDYLVESTSSSPRYYAWNGTSSFLIAPRANVDYTLEIGYNYLPAGLSATNTTTWVSTNAPELLLYAAMIEANLYMKAEQQEITRWTELYQRALEAARNQLEVRIRTDEFRTGEPRG